MLTHTNHKIYGIVEDINKTEKMIQLYKGGNDPADKIMETQHRIRKNKLMRELLSELALSGLSIKNTKGIIQRLTAYIEKSEETIGGAIDGEYDFSEMEKLMAI